MARTSASKHGYGYDNRDLRGGGTPPGGPAGPWFVGGSAGLGGPGGLGGACGRGGGGNGIGRGGSPPPSRTPPVGDRKSVV